MISRGSSWWHRGRNYAGFWRAVALLVAPLVRRGVGPAEALDRAIKTVRESAERKGW